MGTSNVMRLLVMSVKFPQSEKFAPGAWLKQECQATYGESVGGSRGKGGFAAYERSKTVHSKSMAHSNQP
jgi:hypothetical protein